MNSKTACELARKLPDVTEKDHFGSDAFVANKRLFATIWHDQNEVNLRLNPELQRQFLEAGGDGFTEINNSWGRQGWTKVDLQYVEQDLFKQALTAAWKNSAAKVAAPPKSSRPKSKKSSKRIKR